MIEIKRIIFNNPSSKFNKTFSFKKNKNNQNNNNRLFKYLKCRRSSSSSSKNNKNNKSLSLNVKFTIYDYNNVDNNNNVNIIESSKPISLKKFKKNLKKLYNNNRNHNNNYNYYNGRSRNNNNNNNSSSNNNDINGNNNSNNNTILDNIMILWHTKKIGNIRFGDKNDDKTILKHLLENNSLRIVNCDLIWDVYLSYSCDE